jgi:hypothetical protein
VILEGLRGLAMPSISSAYNHSHAPMLNTKDSEVHDGTLPLFHSRKIMVKDFECF